MFDPKYDERIKQIFAKYPDKRSAVMAMLYVAQEQYGWVSPEAIADVAAACEMDPTQVVSIAGFYTMFRERPKGKYWLQVCTDLPCAMKGADQFYQGVRDLAGLGHANGHGHDADDTTADGLFTVEHVTCLAACDRAPMLQCNFHFHESLDLDKVKTLMAEWRAAYESNGVASEAQGLP